MRQRSYWFSFRVLAKANLWWKLIQKNSAGIKPTEPQTNKFQFQSLFRQIRCRLSLRAFFLNQSCFLFQLFWLVLFFSPDSKFDFVWDFWGLFCFSILIKELLKKPSVAGSADLGLPTRIYLPAWSRCLNVKSCLIRTSCVSTVAKPHPLSRVQTSTFKSVQPSSVQLQVNYCPQKSKHSPGFNDLRINILFKKNTTNWRVFFSFFSGLF